MNVPKPYIRKAHFYETDQMGIIHHANYIHWFEEARVDYMEKLGYGYKDVVDSGVDIAVISVSCRYKKTVKFGDTVEITSIIKEIRPSSMTMEYSVKNIETGEICTIGESKHCFMNKEHGLVRLNRALPELYELFVDAAKTSVA